MSTRRDVTGNPPMHTKLVTKAALAGLLVSEHTTQAREKTSAEIMGNFFALLTLFLTLAKVR